VNLPYSHESSVTPKHWQTSIANLTDSTGNNVALHHDSRVHEFIEIAASRWHILSRGVVPLRHLRHVPLPPDSVATLVNSLQNRVKSITLCVTLNANTGKIVLVTLTLGIQIKWLFNYAFWCETVHESDADSIQGQHFYK